MAKPLTADDLLPLVNHLPLPERARLARLIALPPGGDAATYGAQPPKIDEFSSDDETLAWDGDGWESSSHLRPEPFADWRRKCC